MRRLTVRTDDHASADLLLCVPSAPLAGLLWIPALGVSARHYAALAEALADRSIAVALHEPRGGGTSSVRASRRCDWGYRQILDVDMRASLDAARADLPSIEWFVGGHSIGGQFAALFSVMYPRDIAGVALVASGSPYWRAFKRPQRWLLRAALAAVPAITSIAGRYPGRRLRFGGNEASSLMRDWAHSGRTGTYRPRGMEVDLEAAMRTSRLPMLGLHLADDALCPPASLDWLLAKFAAAEVEKSSIPATAFASGAATHFSWMKDIEPVADRLADWLLRHRGADRAMERAGEVATLYSASVSGTPSR